MKEFCCGDVIPGCTSHFSATSEDEILAAVAHHAARDHGIAEVPPEVVSQVRSLIRVTA
ncbi:MAG: DUF1059 domain-containing protein [Dehalococcoidia bacterium]|nr:DUF1059 domain-containing protein [Dehalococcoidia bacterium]